MEPITQKQFLTVVGDGQTIVTRIVNPQGVLGKCNQFRNPASYFEWYERGGVTVYRFPARSSVSGEAPYPGYQERVRYHLERGEEPKFLTLTKKGYVETFETLEKKRVWEKERAEVEELLRQA